jgi:hypothetical protein
VSVVSNLIKYKQFTLTLIFAAQTTLIFKITSPMNSERMNAFKPFKTLAVRALSDIRHSAVASCFISVN